MAFHRAYWPTVVVAVLICQPFLSCGMEISAIGRVAQLGEFYDATDEKFLNQLMFSKKLPAELDLVNTVDTPSTQTKFQVVSTLSQKIDFLDISASMAVSLKCNAFSIDVSGSASYVNEEKQSAKFVEGFLVHKTKTVKETVDLFYEGMRPYVDVMGLMETTATHVVTGIYYGADVTVKFTDTNQENKELQEIEGKLEVEFKMYEIEVKGKAELNITNGDYSNSSSYDLKISGDIPMDTIPRNAYEVVEFIKTISSLLEEINDGKGKPILYILTPLGELQESYNLEYMNAKIVQSIDDGVLNQILEIFEEISKTRQRLNDLQEIFNLYTETCMTPPLKKSLDDLSNAFDTRGGEFTSEIRKGLIGVRSGNESFNLQHIIGNYTQDPHSFESVQARLDFDFDDGLRKIQFYQAFKEHNIDYLTESAYEADLINTDNPIFYVLFYNLALVDGNTAAWDDATNLFLTHLNRTDLIKLKVVDCDFPLGNSSHCSHLTQAVIHGFIKNRKVSSDVVKDYSHYKRSAPIRLPAMENENPFEPEKLYEIGQMYNWKTGEFLDSFLLKKEDNLDNISNDEQLKRLRCEIVPPTWKDTFRALSVPPMLQVPILLKQVGVLGSGQVFTYEKQPEVDRLHLICEKQSQKHFVNVDDAKNFPKSLDLLSLIDNTDGSHFVQAMEYAAMSIVSLEKARSSNSMEDIRQKLEALKDELEAQDEKVVRSNSSADDLIGYKLRIVSDIFPQSRTVAKTFEEVKKVFQDIHHIFAGDVTKGTAVYTLHPTTSIQLEYGIISEPRSINPSITFNGVLEFAGMFDKLPFLEKQIDEQGMKFQEYSVCIPVQYREEIQRMTSSFKSNLQNWYTDLETSFTRFQETGNTLELERSMVDFHKLNAEGEAILETFVSIFNETKGAVDFYNQWRNITDGYVSSKTLWRESFYRYADARNYFLVFTLINPVDPIWKENEDLFGTLCQPKNSTYGTFLMNCSFFSGDFIPCRNVNRPVIHEYKEGNLLSSDFNEKVKAGGDELNELEKLDLDIRKHKNDADEKLEASKKKCEGLTTKLDAYKREVDDTLKNLGGNVTRVSGVPPVGYIYNKYPNTPDPGYLWSSTVWDDVSRSHPAITVGVLMKRTR